MESAPLPGSGNIVLIANDADIEAELRLRGLWPKFLACREEAWHRRVRTGRWGWCLVVAGPGNSLSLFIGLADYPDAADNGYLWYYLADAGSEAGMAQLTAALATHFPDVEASRLRRLAPGEVGSLN